MFQGNCALKFDSSEEYKPNKIDAQAVNLWIEKNKERMKKLSVMQPMNWVEGNCSA